MTPSSSVPCVAEQFDDLEQQHRAGTFGIWVFLASEMMFFGGLFGSYLVYRVLHPAVFAAASHALDAKLGTLETAVLLVSSAFMATGVHRSRNGRFGAAAAFLAVTALLGALFVGLHVHEWLGDAEHGHFPGAGFHWSGPEPRPTEMFFVLYFVTTAFHALHVTIGVFVVSTAALVSLRTAVPGPRRQHALEYVGLYWHFVDVVWIFLYPMFYLAGHR